MAEPDYVPLASYHEYPSEETLRRAAAFREQMQRRRSVRESVGIAMGILITAVHNAGLVALPYPPSRAGFLNDLLGRPENERPVMILVVGYPGENALVPDIGKTPLAEIATFL